MRDAKADEVAPVICGCEARVAAGEVGWSGEVAATAVGVLGWIIWVGVVAPFGDITEEVMEAEGIGE